MTLYMFTYPLQLLVSVSPPGLPVPLRNETYSCHLADSKGRFNITVPAVEVSPRTDYNCDIRGLVPDYQGLSAGLYINYSWQLTYSCHSDLISIGRLSVN